MDYHILIVEDDRDIREGIEIYLKNQGYGCDDASDGRDPYGHADAGIAV